jgi:bifunctional UDP-N-acetylglucosamine pyrophosphorylase/glucosamine-1-phosphate N-acetyltransferase
VVTGIVEQKDATPAEAAVREVNTGIYCFDSRVLFPALHAVRADNSQKEYYLTDVISILGGKGCRVDAVAAANPPETFGVNSRRQLADLEGELRRQIREHWLAEGVTMLDPNSTFIDADVSIGADTVLYPFTLLESGTTVGADCVIGPQVRISNSRIGCGVRIENAVILDSAIADAATVGPFAYIRPGTVVETGAKVGTFVEVKKSAIGRGSKVPHLTYVGDGVIGKGVNIGAGTIFVNYDSRKKHQTVVEDDAFVGCNANLIAPVTIRRGSYVAAGSTITKEVPEGALGIARSRQENLPGWVAKWRARAEKAEREKEGE